MNKLLQFVSGIENFIVQVLILIETSYRLNNRLTIFYRYWSISNIIPHTASKIETVSFLSPFTNMKSHD